MSKEDQVLTAVLKKSKATQDEEDGGFPPALKPIVHMDQSKIFVVQCDVKMSEENQILTAASKKRKVTQDEEDGGFPPCLKPIVTAHPPCKSRLLLSTVESKESDGVVDLDISGTSFGEEDNDGCETPKSEKHQIPKLLTCPPAPRKPRSTAKRKTGEFFYVSPDELNLLFNLLQAKKSQVR
ncbi:hypothetical protein SUGI_0899940 [Cryptomeria japonica]|nr:hypothetical protein SUGI_0899940 [Cryptomeria japonica]